MSEEDVKAFAESMVNAKQKIHFCNECGNFSENEVCDQCLKCSAETICVVGEPKDVVAMEKLKNFNGVFHVLHGCINPLEHKTPNDIRIKELIERVSRGDVKEVVLATNPDVEGEVTATYIAKLLKPLGLKVSRLAQGIQMGSDLQYADEVTITKALEDRKDY